MRYNVRWLFSDSDNEDLPYGLALDINSTSDLTVAPTMVRVHWLTFANENFGPPYGRNTATGEGIGRWDTENGMFDWKFKTETDRLLFVVATSGEAWDD